MCRIWVCRPRSRRQWRRPRPAWFRPLPLSPPAVPVGDTSVSLIPTTATPTPQAPGAPPGQSPGTMLNGPTTVHSHTHTGHTPAGGQTPGGSGSPGNGHAAGANGAPGPGGGSSNGGGGNGHGGGSNTGGGSNSGGGSANGGGSNAGGAAEFKVKLDDLLDAKEKVQQEAATIRSLCNMIIDEMTALTHVWLGPAGGAFAETEIQAANDMKFLVGVLDEMVTRMGTSYDNYQLVEEQNMRNVTQVNQ